MWPEGTGGYLGDELRSGHAQEVTQAVPLGSHNRELCIPGEEKRGAGTVLQLNLPRSVNSHYTSYRVCRKPKAP